MKKTLIYTLTLLGISLVFVTCAKNPTGPAELNGKTSSYIVNLNQVGSSIQGSNFDSKVKEIFLAHKIPISALKYIYRNVLNGFSAYLSEDQVNSLKSDKRVKFVEKDQIFTLVEGVGTGKPTPTPPPTENWGINSVGGNVYGTANLGVAWIIDTGIDYDHPDLTVDQTLSKSFINGKINANDDNGHGTHCAGIIGSSNPLIGVCPGANLIAVKVLNSAGSGTTSDIIAGIDYVAGNLLKDGTGNLMINVVNMSFGGNKSTSLDNAVLNLASQGAFICIAAGNSKKDANNYSPSRVNGDRIFTISAHDINDNFASFSNYGNPPIDYAAPGVDILSCYNNGGYAVMSGTSMAAPHVCAILLGGNGSIYYNKFVNNDRDNNPDPIAQFNTGGGN